MDTSTASTGASLQSDFLERLPTQRRVSDVVQLAPGVADSGGAGEANPSIAGASGLENQYIIDGVNVTNSGYGAIGSYAIVFGSLGSGVPFDFIGEVNLFDAQEVVDYDNYTESSFKVPNPDFGRVIAYQPPRQLRIGARLAW